jgi:hypothetical protein
LLRGLEQKIERELMNPTGEEVSSNPGKDAHHAKGYDP